MLLGSVGVGIELAALEMFWSLSICACFALSGIVLAVVGRSRNPHTRLCALTWNHGDRLGAALLFFGVFTPRYSKKRLARTHAIEIADAHKYPRRRSLWR